ncbi:MAG TPA: SDR family NAD(P)-dependent oxidoreductase [Polyangiaceae bacterium]|nr:SDR family NAD(P)-dependent oxidoreductase [Polyangiaceae bacterium]
MDLKGNTILVTGGSSGIGMAIAERFLALGNEVIITGRREAALNAFKEKHPGVHLKANDAGSAQGRIELAAWVVHEFPRLNVLINNAGIQRRVNLREAEPWADTASEIDINLGGPIHLSALLVPHLQKQEARTTTTATTSPTATSTVGHASRATPSPTFSWVCLSDVQIRQSIERESVGSTARARRILVEVAPAVGERAGPASCESHSSLFGLSSV